jgi:hypothetical protein
LTSALAALIIDERPALGLHVTAFELDEQLLTHLTATLVVLW